MRPAIALLLALPLLLPACGPEQAGPPTLSFSAIPDEDVSGFRQKFQPVAAYLQETLGVPVEYVHSEDYAASVENFKSGHIQLAWFGGLTGVQARHLVPGARAIVQGVEDPAYYSYFIAHADTGLERSDEFPREIANRPFSFGSKSSTSGRLMPEHFIRQLAGKGPDEFFSAVVYSGNHDKTVEWVETGRAEVGAVSYKVYDARVASGKTDPNIVKVIWKTPPYADYNFTARPDLDDTFGAGFTERLQQALIDMTDEDLLRAFKRSAFIPAEDAEFAGIQAIAKRLGFLD